MSSTAIEEPLASLLATRRLPTADGDKNDRGDVLIVGGAATCPGAAILAGIAALRAGAGRVQLVVDPSVAANIGTAFPEAFVIGWAPDRRSSPLPDVLARRLALAEAVVVGPGLGDDGPAIATAVAAHVADDVPLVLDASAVLAAGDLSGHHLVLAPNEREAVELLGPDDAGNVAAMARVLASRLGRPAAVRGVETVIADADGPCWRSAGVAGGLGTAGSGDVLVGVAGAFLARGADALTALAWAVAVHARAGELAARDVGPVGYLARDVADRVPQALTG